MISRRDLLKASALVAVTGTVALAGCTTSARKPTGRSLPNEPDYKGWLRNVSNYDYTVDMRGRRSVSVAVGADGNMGKFAFEPAAVAVSPGTTVTWEWTGEGGAHNVVAVEGTFDSGPLVETAGTTFRFTFDDPAVYKYVCEPHETMGMKGVVLVTLDDPRDGEGG